MSNLGNFTAGAVLYKGFTTVDATGAPTTLSGSPAVRIYDQDNTTEISTGLTLNVDFDGKTGYNLVKIDTASGYTAGHMFNLFISAGTVSAVSVVGYDICSFSIALERSPFDDAYATFQAAGTFGLAIAEWSKKAATLSTALQSGSIISQMLNKDTSQTFDRATDSLEAGIDAAPTTQDLVDAIYNELRSAHTIVNSYGEGVASVKGDVTGSVASVTNPVTPVVTDGLTFVEIMTRINAILGGTAVVTGDDVSFKDRSGNVVATLTGNSGGNRTATL